jgi:hypothetical protein
MFTAILLTATLVARDTPAPLVPLPAHVEKLRRLAEDYHIEISFEVLSPPESIIAGKPADNEAVGSYTDILIGELRLYPKDLIRRSRLRRVALCTKLSVGGQPRAAAPDLESGTLYLDVAAARWNKAYRQHAIHHDFFHMIDYTERRFTFADERWASLNAADFAYGGGGVAAQHLSWSGLLTDQFPGFLNHYSTMAVEEDKAEVFAKLIMNHAYVLRRIKADAVLRAKVQLLQERLTKFCPDMDPKFWQRIKDLKRGAHD